MDKYKVSLIIIAAIIALADIAYLVYLGIQIYQSQASIAMPSDMFRGISTAVIAANAALLCYTIIYLIFRKR